MATNGQPARRQCSKAKRQAQILDAAFKEFAANGYAAARLDDVARRAKIAKGTIFLHFRDKKALFRAVLCSLIQPVRPASGSPAPGSPSTTSAILCDLLSRQYRNVVENKKARALIRLLVAESEKFPELAQIYRQEVVAPGASIIASLLEKGIAGGEFRSSEIRRFPQIVVAPAVLAVMWILLFGDQDLDLQAYRAAHLDLVMHALRPTPLDSTPEVPAIRAEEPS